MIAPFKSNLQGKTFADKIAHFNTLCELEQISKYETHCEQIYLLEWVVDPVQIKEINRIALTRCAIPLSENSPHI